MLLAKHPLLRLYHQHIQLHRLLQPALVPVRRREITHARERVGMLSPSTRFFCLYHQAHPAPRLPSTDPWFRSSTARLHMLVSERDAPRQAPTSSSPLPACTAPLPPSNGPGSSTSTQGCPMLVSESGCSLPSTLLLGSITSTSAPRPPLTGPGSSTLMQGCHSG